MISTLRWRGITFILFLSFFFNSCVRPEDNAINEPGKNPSAIDSEKSGPEVYTVEISEMKFHPEEITVHKGDTVMWVNHDMVAHCVTEENAKSWTSSKISGGTSWKMVVNTSANYFCAIHQVMKGKIIVE
ncbi:MAG TPA: plastocyanin/azurin family copper-binding protein [Chitinophagaceae bacterium]